MSSRHSAHSKKCKTLVPSNIQGVYKVTDTAKKELTSLSHVDNTIEADPSDCWLCHNRTEMRMLRWRNERIRGTRKVGEITKKAGERRLKWYGHVMRRGRDHGDE